VARHVRASRTTPSAMRIEPETGDAAR